MSSWARMALLSGYIIVGIFGTVLFMSNDWISENPKFPAVSLQMNCQPNVSFCINVTW